MLLSLLWERLLDHLPILLCSYWTLATAAAAFTLTPGRSYSKFRCPNSGTSILVLVWLTLLPDQLVAAVQERSSTLSSPRQTM